jgi:hypothetical protein
MQPLFNLNYKVKQPTLYLSTPPNRLTVLLSGQGLHEYTTQDGNAKFQTDNQLRLLSTNPIHMNRAFDLCALAENSHCNYI